MTSLAVVNDSNTREESPEVDTPEEAKPELEYVGLTDKAIKFLEEGWVRIEDYPQESHGYILHAWMPKFPNSGIVLIREQVQYARGGMIFTHLEFFINNGLKLMKSNYGWTMVDVDSDEVFNTKEGLLNFHALKNTNKKGEA